MTVTSRKWLSVSAGVLAFLVAFLFVMPWGCAEVGGVSSWERCTSAMGTPAFSLEDWGLDTSFNILIPVVCGLVVAIVTWGLVGRRRADRP